MDLTTYQGSCCIEGVDVAALKVIPFDGKNWEAAAKAFIERR